jgi:N-acetylglucosaminyldiphosphoundecaprenol N-acetyl-beta-D-mannosaminyltransferase
MNTIGTTLTLSDKDVRSVSFGSLRADAVSHAQALDIVEQLVRRGDGGAIFHANVDAVVLAEDNAQFRAAYSRASLSLADGMPLLWASRFLGERLPEKISGSDFVPIVLERAAERGWRVYFLGGKPGVAELARDKLREKLPALQVVGIDAPAIEENDPPERREPILARVRAAHPDVVVVALGAPKQEIWIDLVRDELRPAVLFAVGASLDFAAGTVPRAPRWISKAGLEWLFRLWKEPRRLWKRYLLRDPKFLPIFARAYMERARVGAGPKPSRQSCAPELRSSEPSERTKADSARPGPSDFVD